MVSIVTPVIDKSVRALCVKPYPNHPKGCPNFGQRRCCPPIAPMIFDTIDLSGPVYAIWNCFDFGAHVTAMRLAHPAWSARQCECCLYWQGKARKQLRERIIVFLREHPGLTVIACPEAQGVNVTETMKQVGINLEWPPQQYAYQVVLAGNGERGRE